MNQYHDTVKDYAEDVFRAPASACAHLTISEWTQRYNAAIFDQGFFVEARGSFWWRNRHYYDHIEISHLDLLLNESADRLANYVHASLDVVLMSLAHLLRFEYEHPWGRFLAFGRDWGLWSDARWALIEKYMEPI